jgi:hypothetical protein
MNAHLKRTGSAIEGKCVVCASTIFVLGQRNR